MNRIQFGEGACERIQKYMDSYISNELLVETNLEVLRHVENCPACATELDARSRLRNRLKAAVNSQAVPPELQARIREKIRRRSSRTWLALSFLESDWARWALAAAAGLVICAGIWLNYASLRLPALADRPAQKAYIQKVSASLAAVLRVGLGDHIHCSIFRKYPQNPPPVEKLEASLGPAYKGLLPVLQAAVPKGYRVIMAHQCSYAGRKFIHLTYEKDGKLISLVATRRNSGESMAGLRPSSERSGISIYESAADRYQVAGFEAGDFLAYVVSELKSRANLQVAESAAPGVRELLMRTPA